VPDYPIVGEFMTRPVFAVGPDSAIDTAGRLMTDKRFSGVPVIDPDGYPIGVVSLMDLVGSREQKVEAFGFDSYFEIRAGEIRAHGGGGRVDGGRIKEIMTPDPLSVSASAPVERAARLMLEHRVHRLLVVDFDRLLGILTSLDVTRALMTRRG
jgi:CBS domain-containing protein